MPKYKAISIKIATGTTHHKSFGKFDLSAALQ
jgi:hypothetical protein